MEILWDLSVVFDFLEGVEIAVEGESLSVVLFELIEGVIEEEGAFGLEKFLFIGGLGEFFLGEWCVHANEFYFIYKVDWWIEQNV